MTVLPRWRVDSEDVRGWREAVRQSEQLPYEMIEPTPDYSDAGRRREADRLAAGGPWTLAGDRIESLLPPIDWTHPSRTFECNLHSWRPLSILNAAYDSLGEQRHLTAATDLALDWIRTYQAPLLDLGEDDALKRAERRGPTMAWNDMATGLRVYRLAFIADSAVRHGTRDDVEIALLFGSLLFHHALLSQESFFSGQHNHGHYQAYGQLAAARRLPFLPGMAEMRSLAESRCKAMIHRSFFPSGAHRENSPGYHHVILRSLVGIRQSNLLVSDAGAIFDEAEEILGWMVMTNASLAPIGDTAPTTAGQNTANVRFSSPTVRFLLSGGADGVGPAPQGLRVVPDAGYVFFRKGGTYLAQTTAYHSRVHKQADHFSFVWCEDGREVLVDPGKFAYLGRVEPGSAAHKAGHRYSDPRRIYVEKTRAHNCVEIDGLNYPLRGRFSEPYGAGLRQALVSPDGLLCTLCEGVHFGVVAHKRRLILAPGRFLLVLDWLNDPTGALHDFRQWFQLAETWSADWSGPGFKAVRNDGRRLRIASLAPAQAETLATGRTEPELLGWRSDKVASLVPSPTLSFDQTARATAIFATLLCLTEDLEVHPDSRVEAGLSGGRIAWRDDSGESVLEFGQGGDDADVRFHGAPI